MTAEVYPHLVWANKPGCSKAVAEIWIDKNELWAVIFIDDLDNILKIEIFPSMARKERQLHFIEMEKLMMAAKHDLLSMASSKYSE